MNEKLKLHIEKVPGSFGVRVYFYRELPGAVEIIGRAKDSEDLISKRVPDGQYMPDILNEISPTLSVQENLYREILQAFSVEAMGHGIETHNSFIQGKLEAKEEHLADTKKILEQVLPLALREKPFNKN